VFKVAGWLILFIHALQPNGAFDTQNNKGRVQDFGALNPRLPE